MTIDVQVEPFGPDAARALARLVAAAQAEDPLARVTVVVPSGPVALATRRLLASGRRGTGPPGIIGVRFLRMAALAEEIGGIRVALGGRRPATAAVVLAAVRAALADVPGPLFRPVRDHPATLSALAATYRELSHVAPADLGALAASGGQAAEVVRLIGVVRNALVAWYDEVDVAEAARAMVDEGPATSLADLGPVIVYLPLTMIPAHEQLLRAIARHTAVTVLLGCTGDPTGDEPAVELAGRLGGRWTSRPEQPVVGGQRVVDAPSADAEVLLALREVMDRHRRGTPLERMALVYGGGEPYARLVRETLEQAQIPFNGRGVRPLSATLAGRILLGAFALADNDWRRDEVMAWLASAPIAFDGRPVPGTAWDLLSAEAGITSGLPGWREHLTVFAEELRSRLDRPGGDAARAWSEHELATATRLLGFIEQLAGRLNAPPVTWDGWARWSRTLLHDLSGGQNRAGGWPPEEAAAFTAVEDTLAGLGLLDEVDPGPSATAFRSALSSELEAPAPQTSRFGRGLLVGRIGDLIGLDMETVFVIGMTDAAFPGRVADDPLVPDAQRSTHPALPPRGARASEARRDYLAALASADVRILSYARGDQRGGRVQRPSRWLLDTLGALVAGGRRLYLGDLAGLDPHPAFVQVPSYAAAVAGPGEPLSIDDRDLRSLVRWTAGHRTVNRHFLVDVDPVLRRGLETQRGRREDAFTRFDGRIEGQDVPSPANGREQSATGLEAYAACPRRYLFERVLRITVRERPEEIVSISAVDRGTMVHQNPPGVHRGAGRPSPRPSHPAGHPLGTRRPGPPPVAGRRRVRRVRPARPDRSGPLLGGAEVGDRPGPEALSDRGLPLPGGEAGGARGGRVPVRLRRLPSGGGAARRPADRPLPGRRRPGRPPPRSPGAGRRAGLRGHRLQDR